MGRSNLNALDAPLGLPATPLRVPDNDRVRLASSLSGRRAPGSASRRRATAALQAAASGETGRLQRLFRALLLERLHRAERLSSDFHARLLEWCPSGLSVFAQQIIELEDTERLEHIARYIAASRRILGLTEG